MSRRPASPAGMTLAAVLEVVGRDLTGEIHAIDRRTFSFGEHWLWWHGQTLYTPAGLERLAAGLQSAGHVEAADRLTEAVRVHCDDQPVEYARGVQL